MNWSGGEAWQRIFDFGVDANSYMFLTPSSGDSTMRFAIKTDENGSEQFLETDSLPTDEWVHISVTLSGNTGVIYVNGEPRVAGQIELDPSDVDPTNHYIGKSQFPDPLFEGMIDDLQIFDRGLATSEIAAMVGLPVPRADLDLDGDLDVDDWLIFTANHLSDLTDLPMPMAAALGDLDHDGDSDFDDFRLFQQDYVTIHGSAALAQLLGRAPEPSAAVLMCIAVCLVLGRRLPVKARAQCWSRSSCLTNRTS